MSSLQGGVTLKRSILFDFFTENKFTYMLGIFFMFLASYIQTLLPKVLGNTFDIMKIDGFDEERIFINILYMLLIALGTFISTFLWRYFVNGNARKLECHIREYLFQHFQTLSPEFYSKRKTGDLIAYAINDISAVRTTFGPASALSFNGIVICVSSIYFMFTSINSQLTLITLAPLPVVIYLTLIIGNQIQTRFKKVQESFGAISDKVQENIYGIRVIKSYVQEDKEIHKFEQLNDQMMEANIQLVRTSACLAPIIELCFSISFVLSLVIGGNMVLQGSISLGDFVAFNGFLTMIMVPIVSIGRVVNLFQRGMASLERLNEIFRTKPDVEETAGALQQLITGDIEFRHLTFRYPGTQKASLEDINLQISQGQILGIIGKTGSGKSTLANLLLKLYNANPEEILLDHRDINDYSLDFIRNSFSFVPQDTFLFSATIKDNIVCFKDIYHQDDIEKAAQYSHIYDSIIGFPEGFKSMVGERGVNLSGGQKQRMAIARAIIKDAPVLILDDALSAVDTITETHILKNLKFLRKDKTTLIISHRISAVKDADAIIVMDYGRICEQGTHAELLDKGGLYYEIFQNQAK